MLWRRILGDLCVFQFLRSSATVGMWPGAQARGKPGPGLAGYPSQARGRNAACREHDSLALSEAASSSSDSSCGASLRSANSFMWPSTLCCRHRRWPMPQEHTVFLSPELFSQRQSPISPSPLLATGGSRQSSWREAPWPLSAPWPARQRCCGRCHIPCSRQEPFVLRVRPCSCIIARLLAARDIPVSLKEGAAGEVEHLYAVYVHSALAEMAPDEMKATSTQKL